jgi:hypothetical protein
MIIFTDTMSCGVARTTQSGSHTSTRFPDSAGHEWRINITVGAYAAIHEEEQIDWYHYIR